jgi:hypothetical protein
MVSSRRFTNSGLNARLISSLTLLSITSNCDCSELLWKPSPFPFPMSRAPRLEVMITTVFLKSITRP